MSTWVWIVIAIVAIVLIAALVFGRRVREKRLVQRREKAQELRQEADQRTQRAKEREAIAQEHIEQARSERGEAAKVGARADRVDPDSDN